MPTIAATTKSAGRAPHKWPVSIAAATNAAPSAIGMRMPTRSASRPTGTAKISGGTA
jgi:hypothetical protein